MFILLWYGVEHPDKATEDSLERFTGEKEFLPLTFDLLLENCSAGMSIPMLLEEDIVGLECLVLRSMFEELVVYYVKTTDGVSINLITY